MLVKQKARKCAPRQIRINSVCPGALYTSMIAATGLIPEFLDGMSRQAPLNRWLHAAEIAEATISLSSSQASAITGADLPVNGGATLYH